MGCYLALSRDVGYNCFSPPGHFLVHSEKEAQEQIHRRIMLFDEKKLGKFPIFLKATGEFIGTCGMETFEFAGEEQVELGYRLCLKHWGRGYALEAATEILQYGFGPLDRSKIMAFALPENRPSVKILEKLGFDYLRNFMHKELEFRLYEFSRERFQSGSERDAAGPAER